MFVLMIFTKAISSSIGLFNFGRASDSSAFAAHRGTFVIEIRTFEKRVPVIEFICMNLGDGFRYNSRHSGRESLPLFPRLVKDRREKNHRREIEGASGRGENESPVKFLSLFCPGVAFFLGGYVNDSSPSAGRQWAVRAQSLIETSYQGSGPT
jgi:hypothetical protein